ncbi:MAG: ImmA/IrrE family metallo-endopeptidase [Ignavibacteriales bacterium]|nr:MAG: ImmA/IrrE family metallo-endopeptidase [Ignavibacteriales bacterium]
MNAIAKANAKLLLNKYCITKPDELDLEGIANAEHLIVEETDLQTHLGRILYGENYGIIKIKSTLKEKGQKRFILAHEMGHYFNEGIDPVTGKQRKRNEGLKNCSDRDIYTPQLNKDAETNANIFASELLMPHQWFISFTQKRKFGAELLNDIAEYFGTSLSAGALKYAELGSVPTAIIMSTSGVVKWSRVNEDFPLRFIPNGYKVNDSSAAYDYYKTKIITNETDNVSAMAWFAEDFNINYHRDLLLNEYNIIMSSYDSVLTMLWV